MPSARDLAAGFVVGATLAGGGVALADRPKVELIAASVNTDGTATLSFVAKRDGEQAQPWAERAVCADNTLVEVARLCGVVDGETDRSDNRARPDAFRSLAKRVVDHQANGTAIVKDADEDARKAGSIK